MSLQKNKTDSHLGDIIDKYLKYLGINTPINLDYSLNVDDEYKFEKIKTAFEDIMESLGLDLTDDSLKNTPKRVAKMFLGEYFWGLNPNNFPICTTVENKMNYDEVVLENGITVNSVCEHHFVQIDGTATVAYIPNEKVLGLSKMNRIVEYFSRRPQIQERLTEQIYHALTVILNTKSVAVKLNCKHYCVKSRGVQDSNCMTVTSKLGGAFKDNLDTRAEFFSMAK